jgi:hypothetical protein
MALSVADVYSVRFGAKLHLPQMVQDNIAKLRIVPVIYKPIRPMHANKHSGFRNNSKPAVLDNWREKALVEAVRRVKEREDPEYSDIFTILNKITMANIDKLSGEAIALMQKRDEQFRLRITMLLFDKAISQHAYASVMSEFAKKLNITFPEISKDLQTQIELFPVLYNMTETVTFPDSTDPKFDDKVIEWSKQKDKRRGYAKFMIYLYTQNLITETSVESSIVQVLHDLDESVKQPKTIQMEENVTQFVEFISETTKLIPKNSVLLRGILRDGLTEFLKMPKDTIKNLNMRSRFRIEDTLKCVQ